MEAIESANRLKDRVLHRNSSIRSTCFQADATKEQPDFGGNNEIDFVITDVPYGEVVRWTADTTNPIETLLENQFKFLTPRSIVVIIADKKQTIENVNYKRLEKFKVGKRQVVFLEPR